MHAVQPGAVAGQGEQRRIFQAADVLEMCPGATDRVDLEDIDAVAAPVPVRRRVTTDISEHSVSPSVACAGLVQDDPGHRRIVGDRAMEMDWITLAASGGSFGRDGLGHVVADVHAFAGKKSDDDDGMRAQSLQGIGEKRGFLQARRFASRERRRRGHLLGVTMQGKRPAWRAGGAMADQQDGCLTWRNGVGAARMVRLGLDDVGESGMNADGRTQAYALIRAEQAGNGNAGEIAFLHEEGDDMDCGVSDLIQRLGD